LSGIDAPEKGQAFSDVAKSFLSDMVYGQLVEISYSKVDRYKRVVGKVLLSGRDVNLELVNAGLAWHYKEYQNEQPIEDRLAYSDAETTARESRLGLWRDTHPIAPWEFRKSKRNKK
jgi:endonuclease YncB( thermonuclease family)